MTEVEAAVVSEPVETAPVGEVTEVGGTEPVEVPTQEPVASETPAQTFKVKVGDAEQEVSLEDLQSGFMRQADYTRKTQEVAAMRQRLAQAESIANSLEADPEGTLRALAQAFGVGVSDDGGFEPAEVDPTDQRISAIERTFQAQEQARVRAEIDSEINTLLDTHGDFDLAATIAHAAKHGMTVTSAYRDLNFDTAATKAAEAERILAEKRAAGVVEGGAHRTAVVEADDAPTNNIREAWAKAKKQLGVA